METNKSYRGFKDLKVYPVKFFLTLKEIFYKRILFHGVNQLAYQLALEIFELTKSFPKEKRYSLVDQIRRSSKSICTNIAEAWYKRRYPKSFVNKLIDFAGESGETEVWIDFSFDFNYMNLEQKTRFLEKYSQVGKMLNSMINQPEKFCH